MPVVSVVEEGNPGFWMYVQFWFTWCGKKGWGLGASLKNAQNPVRIPLMGCANLIDMALDYFLNYLRVPVLSPHLKDTANSKPIDIFKYIFMHFF